MKLTVNEKEYEVEVSGNPNLLEVLREQIDLTGAKYGCGEGACGACKVLVNGTPAPACITPAVSVQGKNIITVEGLGKEGQLHAVQKDFIDEDVFQCAYCASGMAIAAVGLFSKQKELTEQEIKEGMNDNICRCCTYPDIIKAIKKASENKINL
ncbi:MAG: (2Fe-2S)-binding protein [Cyclobacteriaceae bacterium]